MSLKSLFLFLCLLAATFSYSQDSDKFIKQTPQEGYTLFFIKPAEFKADGEKAKMRSDFTFQHSQGKPGDVDMRFSIISKKPIRQADSLSFYRQGEQIASVKQAETMYLEKSKGKWLGRYEADIPYATLLGALEAGASFTLEIHYGNEVLSFPAGKDWRKASEVVVEILAVEIK